MVCTIYKDNKSNKKSQDENYDSFQLHDIIECYQFGTDESQTLHKVSYFIPFIKLITNR